MSEVDPAALRHHGDLDVAPGDRDFAVNVLGTRPPAWLVERLASRLADLATYPGSGDLDRARTAVADLHGVDPARVLPLAGSAEGFHLVAALAARRGLGAAVVHPSFTEPEAEFRAAGVEVRRVVLEPPFALDPALVPDDADAVVVGNPTNPTSVLHPRATLAALCRPGRITVVDEAFCDVVDDEAAVTLAGTDLPGLLVLRSLTKTWALAGLRVGYALAAPELVEALSALRPHWATGTLQLEALAACSSARATAELATVRGRVRDERGQMVSALAAARVEVVVAPAGPFVLVRVPRGVDGSAFRRALARRGVAVRRCDTFPGLDERYLRLAVRGRCMVGELLRAWDAARDELAGPAARTRPQEDS